MMPIVLDASTAIQWMMPLPALKSAAGEMQDAATRGNLELHVPGLYFAEVGHWGWRAQRKGRPPLRRGDARALVSRLTEMDLYVTSDRVLLPQALTLAFELTDAAQSARPPAPEVKVYDALYLALAEVLDLDLWTCDEKLYNAVRAGAPKDLADRVKLLGTDPFDLA